MRLKLEQVKREAAEMKAMESKIKLNMKREEAKARTAERDAKAKDLAQWRQQQSELAKVYDKEVEQERLHTKLAENKDFQEAKRGARLHEKEEEAHKIKADYMEHKEDSRIRVEMQTTVALNRQRVLVEEHLENMQVVAEYQLEEQIREKREEEERRAAQERAELDLQLRKAVAERARELENLGYIRGKKDVSIPRRLDGSLHSFP